MGEECDSHSNHCNDKMQYVCKIYAYTYGLMWLYLYKCCVHVGVCTHVQVSGLSHVGIWVWGSEMDVGLFLPTYFRVLLPVIYIFRMSDCEFPEPSSFCPLQGEDTGCVIKTEFKKSLGIRTDMSSFLCGRHSTDWTTSPAYSDFFLIYYLLKIYLG